MPEGDTIFRAAAKLRRVLLGQVLGEAEAPRLPANLVGGLVGRTVTCVEARGKHLLIHLDPNLVLHTHLGMDGRWRIGRRDVADGLRHPDRRTPRADLRLATVGHDIRCQRPKILELLAAEQLPRHPLLGQLGPDLLADTFDEPRALARLSGQPSLPLGEALLDQRLVCGIGNVYKSEVMFLEHCDPFSPVGSFSSRRLAAVLSRVRSLMRHNLVADAGRRRTRFGRDGARLWIYGRAGQHCLRCGTQVRMRRQGLHGRSTYWCPACQPPSQVDELDEGRPDGVARTNTGPDVDLR